MSKERFFVGGDNSGHEYIVPLGRYYAWHDWLELPDEDERSWDAPAFARRIDGGSLTFTDPRIE